jgi:hypothetical protein
MGAIHQLDTTPPWVLTDWYNGIPQFWFGSVLSYQLFWLTFLWLSHHISTHIVSLMQQSEMASILSCPLVLLYVALCVVVYTTTVSPAIHKGQILVSDSVMMSSPTQIQNEFRTSCKVLITFVQFKKLWPDNFYKLPNIKIHKNLYSCSWVITCTQTGRKRNCYENPAELWTCLKRTDFTLMWTATVPFRYESLWDSSTSQELKNFVSELNYEKWKRNFTFANSECTKHKQNIFKN